MHSDNAGKLQELEFHGNGINTNKGPKANLLDIQSLLLFSLCRRMQDLQNHIFDEEFSLCIIEYTLTVPMSLS
jgi:hypothetical protein